MAKKTEKFKTMIGGQALIEGIMMRGPEKDAIVVRGKDGLQVSVNDRKLPPKRSILRWPLIRGVVNFFDSQVVGVKAIMASADLAPEEYQDEPSKLDKWLEKKLGEKGFQNLVVGFSVILGLLMSVGLFFLLPMVIGDFINPYLVNPYVDATLLQNLLEGVMRIIILLAYMKLAALAKDVKRMFAYHGAEHKTISCYEAGLPLTVENVRQQSKHHPRCGTSFLIVVMILAVLIFTVGSSVLLQIAPSLELLKESEEAVHNVLYKLIMVGFKLALLPVVVSITYEINRWIGRHDNWFTKLLAFPGLLTQRVSTYEPDDGMIEVAIEALTAVLPEQEGADKW